MSLRAPQLRTAGGFGEVLMSGDGRAVPYFCPFCGEDYGLRPHGETRGTWQCRACRRVFSVKMIGLLGRDAS